MSYKVIVKKKGNGVFANSNDIVVLDDHGNAVKGIQSINFSAHLDEFPKLEIVTLIDNFELEVAEENTTITKQETF